MNLQPENLLTRCLLCIVAGVALNGMAQQPPQNYEDSMNHPWRLEKISPDDDWTRHFRVGGLVGFNVKANFSMSGSFNIAQNHPPGVYDDGYVLTDSTEMPED